MLLYQGNTSLNKIIQVSIMSSTLGSYPAYNLLMLTFTKCEADKKGRRSSPRPFGCLVASWPLRAGSFLQSPPPSDLPGGTSCASRCPWWWRAGAPACAECRTASPCSCLRAWRRSSAAAHENRTP